MYKVLKTSILSVLMLVVTSSLTASDHFIKQQVTKNPDVTQSVGHQDRVEDVHLLVVYSPECTHCHEWMDKVYPFYETHENKSAFKRPMIRLMSLKDNNDLVWINEHLSRVIFTPTFILWSKDKEVYRFRGFSSKVDFFDELDVAMNNIHQKVKENVH
ncbi:MAG TPA: hypothetical protein QF353_00850 [Gammaproteobacteria bacterium]|nr:hypothetical protein [Gammaproteobacteria bacterium]